MDTLNLLMQGFATAATPINLMWAFVGCIIGTAVGVLPGIGPAVAVAMLLPITVKVEATAAIGSFVAGTIATILVTFFAPLVAEYAVRLGPPEYFMLMVLAFTTVSAVLGKSTLRGMVALFVGLAMGLIGIDQLTGQARYTGGVPELMDGIEVVLI